MATTLKTVEGAPEHWPRILRDDDPSIEYAVESQLRKTANAAWQRVEAFIGWRWGERDCVFTVEGPGHWNAPLQPAIITLSEIWRDDAWEAVTLRPSPLGGVLLAECAHYRVAATVGSADDPPRAVKEAVFRLAEYFLAAHAIPTNERIVAKFKTDKEFPDPDDFRSFAPESPTRAIEFEHHGPTWIARAMQYSGAADLLRPWRNLGAA